MLRRQLRQLAIVYAAVLVAVFALLIQIESLPNQSVLQIEAGLTLALLYSINYRSDLRNRAIKKVVDRMGPGPFMSQYEVNDSGITLSSRGYEWRASWSAVKRVEEPEYYYEIDTDSLLFNIPRRLFGADDGSDRWVSAINSSVSSMQGAGA